MQTLLLFGASTKSFKKTNKTKIMLCKSLLILLFMAEIKAFEGYTTVKNEVP